MSDADLRAAAVELGFLAPAWRTICRTPDGARSVADARAMLAATIDVAEQVAARSEVTGDAVAAVLAGMRGYRVMEARAFAQPRVPYLWPATAAAWRLWSLVV